MVVSSSLNLTWPSRKTKVKLLLQNWPIDSRALFWSAGKTWARRAARGNCGKVNSAVWVDCIVSPLGSLTEMPGSVGTFLTQGFSGPMKWLVHPESTTARRSLGGLGARTKVLQENKLFKTKESLGLTFPGLCQGSGLQFLCVPHFLSWRVAYFWWPVAGVVNFRLEWLQQVQHVQK